MRMTSCRLISLLVITGLLLVASPVVLAEGLLKAVKPGGPQMGGGVEDLPQITSPLPTPPAPNFRALFGGGSGLFIRAGVMALR